MPRLRPDHRPAGRALRRRQGARRRRRRGGAAQYRPSRPHRRMGRDGGRRRAGLRPFRQCARQHTGRALWRARATILHRALLRRRAARGSRPAGARFRHLRGCGRQGAGRGQRRQAGAGGRADRRRGTADERPRRALRHRRARRAAAVPRRQGRHPRDGRAQGLGPRADVRAAGRRTHRQRRLRTDGEALRQRHVLALRPAGRLRPG